MDTDDASRRELVTWNGDGGGKSVDRGDVQVCDETDEGMERWRDGGMERDGCHLILYV